MWKYHLGPYLATPTIAAAVSGSVIATVAATVAYVTAADTSAAKVPTFRRATRSTQTFAVSGVAQSCAG